MTWLAASTHLTNLRTLDLRGADLPVSGFEALDSTSHLPGLERVHVLPNLPAHIIKMLRNSERLAHVMYQSYAF